MLAASVIAFVSGCGKVDALFEGPGIPDARLSVAVDSAYVFAPRGTVRSVIISVTPVGTYTGPVNLTVERLPDGVTAVVDQQSTTGPVTTARVTFTISLNAQLAVFNTAVRARGDHVTEGSTDVSLNITPPLSFALSTGSPTLVIARGGSSQLTASIARTNFSGPVTLALAGDNRISATFAENPLSVNVTTARIAVASDVPPGVYALTLRASGALVAEQTAPVSVQVTDEPLQLLAPNAVTVAQGTSGDALVIVNKTSSTGADTVIADALPSGLSYAVGSRAADGTRRVTIAAAAATLPGTYRITLRARASGAPESVASLDVQVLEAKIQMSLAVNTVELFQASNGRVQATVLRTAYAGPVSYTLEGAPEGLSLTALPDSGDASIARLVVSATSGVDPRAYDVVVRADPTLLGGSKAVRANLVVVVHPAAAGSGNVLLDWSRCVAPLWVAGQDGTGAWLPLSLLNGTARFNVSAATGAFAYAEDGFTLVVRYYTRQELTSGPIDVCPTPPGTKTVRGVSAHTAIGEAWSYAFGGATAQTTITAPNFVLNGVTNGTHDFVGWGAFLTGFHALIRRDIDVPDGEAFDAPFSLVGSESFNVSREALSVANTLGEAQNHVMGYLTTSACTLNPMYASGTHGTSTFMWGIPEGPQRATDFHFLTVNSIGTNTRRSVSVSFNKFGPRGVTQPPVVPTPTVRTLSGPYTRLQLQVAAVPSAYNETVELKWSDGLRTTRVQGSVAAIGSSNVTLTMPDFSTVGAFPLSVPIPAGATGTYTMTLVGATMPGSRCQAERVAVTGSRSGPFAGTP